MKHETRNMRMIFLGTPDFAVPFLQTLVENKMKPIKATSQYIMIKYKKENATAFSNPNPNVLNKRISAASLVPIPETEIGIIESRLAITIDIPT